MKPGLLQTTLLKLKIC